MTAPATPPDLGALLGALARALAPLIAREIAAVSTAAPATNAEYYTAASPPPGMTRRTFLAAARAGAFPSEKRGKAVRARRADVDAWFAAGRRMPSTPANDTDLAALAAQSVARSVTGGKR